jgi:hypothetical protein
MLIWARSTGIDQATSLNRLEATWTGAGPKPSPIWPARPTRQSDPRAPYVLSDRAIGAATLPPCPNCRRPWVLTTPRFFAPVCATQVLIPYETSLRRPNRLASPPPPHSAASSFVSALSAKPPPRCSLPSDDVDEPPSQALPELPPRVRLHLLWACAVLILPGKKAPERQATVRLRPPHRQLASGHDSASFNLRELRASSLMLSHSNIFFRIKI